METIGKYYIRFGEIPEDERSGVYGTEERVGTEDGVSVYDCVVSDDGTPRVVLPTPLSFQMLCTIEYLVEYDHRTMFLVTGDRVGSGSDAEPLIRNVRIVREIPRDELIRPKPERWNN